VHFDSYWHEVLKAADIEDFRFHDLRHTCASYLAGQVASLLDVLGHRTHADDDAVRALDSNPQGGGDRENGQGAQLVGSLERLGTMCEPDSRSWSASRTRPGRSKGQRVSRVQQFFSVVAMIVFCTCSAPASTQTGLDICS